MAVRHRQDERRQIDPNHPIFWVQRIAAGVVGLGLVVFGAFGFAGQVGFFTTHGVHVMGMSSNGLLATLSVIVGVLLIGAGVRGGRTASNTMILFAVLFELAGFAGLIVLNGPANVLAFTIPNVIFSLAVGLVLLFFGLYGRGGGQIPGDSPYLQMRQHNPVARIWHDEDLAQDRPADPEAARRRLAEIEEDAQNELAVAEGTATPEQMDRALADAVARSQQRRDEAWRRAAEPGQSGDATRPPEGRAATGAPGRNGRHDRPIVEGDRSGRRGHRHRGDVNTTD